MAKSFLIWLLAVFILVATEVNTFGARGIDSTPEAFLEKGAWVLLGEVVELRVTSQEAGAGGNEYGTIFINVNEVLDGRVNQAVVSFPYKRLTPLNGAKVNPVNWDMLPERPEVGTKLIIYFMEKNGTYSLFDQAPMFPVLRTNIEAVVGIDHIPNPVQLISSYDDLEVIKLREAVRVHHLPITAYALPNPYLTPGATREVTWEQMCTGAVERDPWYVSPQMKKEVCLNYGIKSDCPGPQWEIDHLISRYLGGTDDILNLWPQPIAEARIKRYMDGKLYRAVCSDWKELKNVQKGISEDWRQFITPPPAVFKPLGDGFFLRQSK